MPKRSPWIAMPISRDISEANQGVRMFLERRPEHEIPSPDDYFKLIAED
jgi:hypothetical protein